LQACREWCFDNQLRRRQLAAAQTKDAGYAGRVMQ
jgi:hypothetical protein